MNGLYEFRFYRDDYFSDHRPVILFLSKKIYEKDSFLYALLGGNYAGDKSFPVFKKASKKRAIVFAVSRITSTCIRTDEALHNIYENRWRASHFCRRHICNDARRQRPADV